jgi:hypothetical protein
MRHPRLRPPTPAPGARLLATALLALLVGVQASCGNRASDGAAGDPITVRAHEVFETVLRSDRRFADPFHDARLRAQFVSPAGETVAVDGFFAGNGEWRARFVPRAAGTWRYQAVLTGDGRDERLAGAFVCAGSAGDGFLRQSARNRYRLEYESGRPFYPIGVQTCGAIAGVDLDGPNPDGSWRAVEVEEWCRAFRGAVNLVRVQFGTGTRAGCAVDLIPDRAKPGAYGLENAAGLDRMYALHRAAGFSQIAILFQDMSAYGRGDHAFGSVCDRLDFKSLTAANLALQEQYLRYVVARYACYVDIWEIFNEDSFAPDDYLRHLYRVIREADPYDHPITTNFSRPEEDYCDLIVPHQYVAIPDLEVDALVAKDVGALKSYGKVVQYTEFGNKNTLSNDDPVKWRLAAWTALMNESGMLFWSMSGRKTSPSAELSGNSNAYLGRDSRAHFRALLDFVRDLPITARPQAIETVSQQFRAYCLGDRDTTMLYLHHFRDHGKPTEAEPLRVQLGAGRYRVHWIDPADGKPLAPDPPVSGSPGMFLMITVPPFAVDAACRIDRIAALPEAVAIPAPPPADPAGPRWRASWKPPGDGRTERDWSTFDGMVDERDAVLQINAQGSGEGLALLHSHRFPASVRVEFVGLLIGDQACDLDVMLNAGNRGTDSGYLFQVGGKGNTMTRLLRDGKPVASTERPDLRLVPGKAYRVVAERERGTVRLRIDGVEVFAFDDSAPLGGRGYDRIAFYTYGGIMCVSDLTVQVLAEAEP